MGKRTDQNDESQELESTDQQQQDDQQQEQPKPEVKPPPTAEQRTIDVLPKWAQDQIRELRQENANQRVAQKQKDEEALVKQGNYEKLYNDLKAELKAEQDRREAEQLQRWAAEVCNELGLAVEMAPRLFGKTKAELKADAEVLKASLPKPMAPATEGGRGGSTTVPVNPAAGREERKAAMRAKGGYNP